MKPYLVFFILGLFGVSSQTIENKVCWITCPPNYTKNSKHVFTNQKMSPWGCVLVGCLEFILEGTFFDVKDLVQVLFCYK
jgi:hypothetical protein